MKRVLAVLACAALAGTACSEAPSGTGRGRKAGPTNVGVSARDYSFEIPSRVEGGVVTLEFDNSGQKNHQALIARVGSGGEEEVIGVLEGIFHGDGEPIPSFLDFAGGVAHVSAGRTASTTLELEKGTYALFCTLTDNDSLEDPTSGPDDAPMHMRLGMYQPFEVTEENEAEMPARDGVLVAADHTFELPELKAGETSLVFRNEGPKELHVAAFSEFPEGVTEPEAKAAFDAFFGAPSQSGPAGNEPVPEEVTVVGPLGPGGAQTFELDLKEGRTYAIRCFMTDRAGGSPHDAGAKMIAFFST
jgi:hypothetical protein